MSKSNNLGKAEAAIAGDVGPDTQAKDPASPLFSKKLYQQCALVAGASGGIGRCISLALAMAGARLCLVGRDESRLNCTADLCRPFGQQVNIRICDLTDETAIKQLCRCIDRAFGRLDILVHCAGIISHGKLEEAAAKQIDLQYAANVRGPLVLTQKALPLLRRPRGQIVFINSSAGLTCAAGRGHFAATQHALKSIADTLRQEVNGDDVRVLSVFPGRTATTRTENLCVNEGRAFEPDLLLQPEDVAAIVIDSLTLPWTAEVTEISIRPMKKSY
ncbi:MULTISPECIES: SDR family NAD(P)-dependent oxidoreductase [Mesorhizobium]|uniref:SDR family oxidoreductase n=1 Tax=Mesorhizobium TaxID=68287 RepID=UPI000FCA551A|nr:MULTISPECIES: SDR family NAD(P)-dependent oxidoreductase [Mesorhizobium]RVC59056.1 SDR family NAD(P)-dependent oxidoreductase [Mesorhizobium sp. M4B.F.Ca.ET.088.02.2.1]MDX8434207.1 SDR family NAD(P)-dependent oxidoreductase [Mesorhizobium abyssinicae]RUW22124.1 SDR family NAD(P)-dependent oxidoreductase [Mesorhizobium sp. M4B.F.Ca.ET.013.02.1.1]RVD16518.1 SDR family NAD(P)-dependent oxidoreductase [Mesorhizobium sp. M4B.F.Ca.ET.017.02.2.1]RVD35895.1 SDR family NAD(P)-dependent oxidoreductas